MLRIFILQLCLDVCHALIHCMLKFLATLANIHLSIGVTECLIDRPEWRNILAVAIRSIDVNFLQITDRCWYFLIMFDPNSGISVVRLAHVSNLRRDEADFDSLDRVRILSHRGHRHLGAGWAEPTSLTSVLVPSGVTSWITTLELNSDLTSLKDWNSVQV